MIHDQAAPAARTRALAALVGNTGQAVLDEAHAAGSARAEARLYRAAIETVLTHLSRVPKPATGGAINASDPGTVLWYQRPVTIRNPEGGGSTVLSGPEPHWERVRAFLSGVLGTTETGPQNPEVVLESLHVQRRTESLVAPAQRAEVELYNEANGSHPGQVHQGGQVLEGAAWHPQTGPATDQTPAAQRPTRPAIPATQRPVPEQADAEITMLIPPVRDGAPVPDGSGDDDDAPGETAPAASPGTVTAPAGAPAAGQGAPSPASALPIGMANDGNTVTMRLELNDGKDTAPTAQPRESRPLALTGAPARGKTGAPNRGRAGAESGAGDD